MIAKGWSTCRLYRSAIVTPSTRHDHLSHQSYPALLPVHRQWIPAHHPCCYLCLTARKRKIKAQLQGIARAQLFPLSKTWESQPSGRKLRLPSSSPLHRFVPTKPAHTHTTSRLYPLCLDNFVCNQFWLWNPNELTVRSVCYMLRGGKELSVRFGRCCVSMRAAAAQRRLNACQWLSPNPGLIFVFDPQHGPETAWAAAIAVI